MNKIRYLRFFFSLFFGLSIWSGVFAQNTSSSDVRTITGVVFDESKEPVIGANILVKGTTIGTLTDVKGVFKLELPQKEKQVIVSFIGYKPKELNLTNESHYTIFFEGANVELEDIVVIGYGTAKKKDLTGSVQHINIEDSPIANLPNTNPLAALSGTVAGLTVSPASRAGQDPLSSMNIRGDNSIDPISAYPDGMSKGTGLNRPMIVVDDVIFNGSINEINMQDVASINVLKDASSAAIYGSRSANGVILITTKKGKSDKPIISLNSSYAIQSWSRKPKMQYNIETLLKNRYDYNISTGRLPEGSEFDPYQLMSAQERVAYDAGHITKWLDEITQYAPVQNYNISLSASAKNINYYLSAGMLDQKGVIYNDHYKKMNFMGKLESNINEYITLGAKASFYTADNSGLSPTMQSATWLSPLSYTTTLTEGYESWVPSNPSGSSAKNPLVGFDRQVGPAYGENEDKDHNIDGTAWLQIKVPWVQGLSYRASINGSRTNSIYNLAVGAKLFVDTRNTVNMDNYESFWNRAYAQAQTGTKKTWVLDQILSYVNSFNEHNVDAIVGYTRDAYRYDQLLTEGNGFDMPNPIKWYGINLANTQKVSYVKVRYQNVATIARLNYNYKYKYYFTGTFRRDGFSGFASGNKFGNFPGMSVGWAISEENFMKRLNWVSYLKLRLSWGQTGNQSISAYETLSTVAKDYAVFGNDPDIAIYPSNMSNAKLSWSTTTVKNIGIDYNFFNNRLTGSVDAYKSTTRDQLLTRNLPHMSGFSTVRTNIGRVDNTGIEFMINGIILNGDGKDGIRWESGVVFAKNKNKIVELYGTYDNKGNPINDISGAPSGDAYIVGKPIHAVWDYKMLGIVQKDDEEYIKKYNAKPGDVKFLDYNNDGVINSDDRHYLGDRDPLFTLNLNNTFSYKNFSLYFSFKWNAGNDKHYLGKDRYGTMSSMAITNGSQLANVKPWTSENPTNKYPRVDWVNSANYWFWNTREFLKLKDITLSYTFDKKQLAKCKLEGLRVYVSGNNIFTVSNWTGLDPEDGGTIAAQPGSIYYGSFPVLRTVSIGVSLSF